MKKLPMRKTPVPGRACWFCTHVRFSNGGRDYSELTPGYPMTLECGKNYWEFDTLKDSLSQFRDKIMSAEKCSDFVEERRD